MRSHIPVSVIVMTKNEEENLPKCLDSLGDFGQVIVVDSHSEDRTVPIAREFGADVQMFSWNGQYPRKKQWSLENCRFDHDWVLYCDADERVYPDLADEIRQLFAQDGGPAKSGYFIEFDYVFMGRVLKHGHRIIKLALFDRHKGAYPRVEDSDVVNYPEVEGHYQPVVSGAIGHLDNRMLHDDQEDLFHYFQRHNRYSDWLAIVEIKGTLRNAGDTQPGLRKILKPLFYALPMKAPTAFLHSYVLKRGFLDGTAGFHFAVARAFYYWQSRIKRLEFQKSGFPGGR